VVVCVRPAPARRLACVSSSIPSEQQTSIPICATRRTISRTFSEILAFFYLAPRGAHAETRRTLGASASGKFRYFVYCEQSSTGHLCRVMRALRAVGAIFRTSARLNREQAAELDAPRVMEFPMQLLRLEQEIGSGCR